MSTCLRLAGKVAIVTGAASGIGCATARLFALEGATVLAVDRPGSAVAEVHAESPTIVALAQDVASDDAPALIVEAALRAGGGQLDILFNNAGAIWAKKAALRRLGEPIDMARAVLLLASDEADFITGHGLVADGGLTLRT